MGRFLWVVSGSLLLAIATPTLLSSCQSSNSATLRQSEQGRLELQVNGEDYARLPFVSKDGWQIHLQQVAVNMSQITAYQADPTFNVEAVAHPPQGQIEAHLSSNGPVDLAAGEHHAGPIPVDAVTTAAGHYNALTWRLSRATAGPYQGNTLVIAGTASKADRQISFTLSVDREYDYLCGEYIGEQRKGFVKAGQTSEIEATFHFDHIFGDGTRPQDDEVNQAALGFEPLVALVRQDQLKADYQTLKDQLQPVDLQTLEAGLLSLGHVGEGHCRVVAIAP